MTELRNIIRQPDGALALRADEPAIAFCVSVACRACRRRIQEPRREAEPWPSRRGSMSTVRGTSDNPASHFIDEVHTRASLGQLIAHHVTLKRSGSALCGPCPFHESAQASTGLPVHHGRYRFTYGAHGDSISFAMWADRLRSTEAVCRFVHDAGPAVPGEISSTREALSLRSGDPAEEEDCRFVERLKRLGVDPSQLDLYPDYAP
jgi:hypothetical protein